VRMRSKNTGGTDIWADAREVPVAGVVPPSKSDRRARRLRFALRAGVDLLPVTPIALILVLGSRSRPATVAAAVAAPSAQDRAVATIALSRPPSWPLRRPIRWTWTADSGRGANRSRQTFSNRLDVRRRRPSEYKADR
jgi:hypothetical protein